MTESAILDVLNSVSDLLADEPGLNFPVFDTEISAWKKSTLNCANMVYQIAEPVRIRIRTVESWKSFGRHSSSTLSSSNDSHSGSPRDERRKSDGLVGFTGFVGLAGFGRNEDEKLNNFDTAAKVIIDKLPKVLQGSDEE